MKSREKRFLAVLLTAAMVFTSFTVPAFADEITEEPVVTEEAVEIIDEAPAQESEVASPEVAVDATEEAAPAEEAAADESAAEEIAPAQAAEEAAPVVAAEEAAIVGAADGIYSSVEVDSKIASYTVDKDGRVKVTWKGVKGAKTYKLLKVLNGASENSVDASYVTFTTKKKKTTTVSEETKSKSYVDKHFDPETEPVYVVEMFDKDGSQIAVYAAAPQSKLIQISNGTKNRIDIKFANLGYGNHTEYKLERSVGNSKFKGDGYEVETLSKNDITHAVSENVGNLEILTYNDFSSDKANIDVDKSRYHYYKVTPIIHSGIAGGTDVEGKPSSSKKCEVTAYSAPELVTISADELSGHKDTALTRLGHAPGCYSGATFIFKKTDGFFANPIATNLKYEIQYSNNGTSFKSLATIKAASISHNTANDTYSFSVPNLPPEKMYSYRIRAVDKNSKKECSSWSAPMDHSFDFPNVTNVAASDHKSGVIRLSWDSERCATSYQIYRTIDGYAEEADALAAVNAARADAIARCLSANSFTDTLKGGDIKACELKKLKSVENIECVGHVLNADITGVKANKYYGFIVVPANGKVVGYRESDVATGFAVPAAPSNIKVTSSGDKGFSVAWSSVKGATGYAVERITVSEDSVYLDQDNAAWNNWSAAPGYVSSNAAKKVKSFNAYNKNHAKYDSDKAKIVLDKEELQIVSENEIYAYRVKTLYDGGSTEFSDCVTAMAGVRTIKSLKASPIVATEATNKWREDRKFGKRPYAISSNGTFYEIEDKPVAIKIGAASDKKDVVTYEVEKKVGNGAWTRFAEFDAAEKGEKLKGADKYKYFKPNASAFTFYDSNLNRGVEYKYRVRAVYDNGNAGLWKETEFSAAANWMVYAVNRPTSLVVGGVDYKAGNKASELKTTNSKTEPLFVEPGKSTRLYVEYLDAGKNSFDPSVRDFEVSADEGLTISEIGKKKIKVRDSVGTGTTERDVYFFDVTMKESNGDSALGVTLKYSLSNDKSSAVVKDMKYYVAASTEGTK